LGNKELILILPEIANKLKSKSFGKKKTQKFQKANKYFNT